MIIKNLQKISSQLKQIRAAFICFWIFGGLADLLQAQVPVTDANRDGVWVEVSASFYGFQRLVFPRRPICRSCLSQKKSH